jgi:hypothetical protein
MINTTIEIIRRRGVTKAGWMCSIVKRGIVVRNVMASSLKGAMDNVDEYKRIHHQETVSVVFWDPVDGSKTPIETDEDLVMIALKGS